MKRSLKQLLYDASSSVAPQSSIVVQTPLKTHQRAACEQMLWCTSTNRLHPTKSKLLILELRQFKKVFKTQYLRTLFKLCCVQQRSGKLAKKKKKILRLLLLIIKRSLNLQPSKLRNLPGGLMFIPILFMARNILLKVVLPYKVMAAKSPNLR